MKISIAKRIKQAMIGLTLVLCLVFTVLTMLMAYVVEDQVFINLLKNEQRQFEQLPAIERSNWQPSNKQMILYIDDQELPKALENITGAEVGVYEYFDQGKALFILRGKFSDDQAGYLISFDVSDLLAVRSGRTNLLMSIAMVSLVLIILSVWLAYGLANKILSPLKKLTQQLQDENNELPKGFSVDFYGDEVGILAQQLEQSIERAQKAAQREFEFNQGVSHELRSPIQVAHNAVELLIMNHDNTNIDTQAVIQRLERAIKQMNQITEAFLWMASDWVVSGFVDDVKGIMEQLKMAYLESNPNQQIQIEYGSNLNYVAPTEVFVVIMDNLFRNAIQHGNKDKISCVLDNQSIRVENSVENATFRTGHGIGLEIVKRMCKHLNWHFELNLQADKNFRVNIYI
ncbi:MAG: HAMP domain-containing histidine kinase [Proteobacteria bacterium]|nr:HAMP domain-containing histidine kinase [Pseudomonadota bacterium]